VHQQRVDPVARADPAERPAHLALDHAGVGLEVLQHERLVDLARSIRVAMKCGLRRTHQSAFDGQPVHVLLRDRAPR
jgi:hypothetical protein